MIGHVDLVAALFVAQGHDRPNVFLGHEQLQGHDRLANLFGARRIGQFVRIVDHQQFTVTQQHLILYRWCGGDEVHVEFALKTLLHNVHMQEAEEATAKAKAKRLRDLGFELQRGIVELQFLQRLAQRFVLIRFDREQACEHLRLDFLETGQRLGCGVVQQGDGIAHFGGLQFLDAGDDKADFTRRKTLALQRLGGKHTDLFTQVGAAGRHQFDAILGPQAAFHHPHQHHHADIVIEPRINDESLKSVGG